MTKSLDGMLDRLMTGCPLQNVQIHKLCLSAERTQI
jgi:hypothetical protein